MANEATAAQPNSRFPVSMPKMSLGEFASLGLPSAVPVECPKGFRYRLCWIESEGVQFLTLHTPTQLTICDPLTKAIVGKLGKGRKKVN